MKADKGGAIAITDVDNYVQEANRQLFKLTIETTETNRIKVNRTINELKSLHLLDKKIANYLLSSEAKTPQFKSFQKFTMSKTPVDQWSVQLFSILQRFRNTLITNYGRSAPWEKFLTTASL